MLALSGTVSLNGTLVGLAWRVGQAAMNEHSSNSPPDPLVTLASGYSGLWLLWPLVTLASRSHALRGNAHLGRSASVKRNLLWPNELWWLGGSSDQSVPDIWCRKYRCVVVYANSG